MACPRHPSPDAKFVFHPILDGQTDPPCFHLHTCSRPARQHVWSRSSLAVALGTLAQASEFQASNLTFRVAAESTELNTPPAQLHANRKQETHAERHNLRVSGCRSPQTPHLASCSMGRRGRKRLPGDSSDAASGNSGEPLQSPASQRAPPPKRPAWAGAQQPGDGAASTSGASRLPMRGERPVPAWMSARGQDTSATPRGAAPTPGGRAWEQPPRDGYSRLTPGKEGYSRLPATASGGPSPFSRPWTSPQAQMPPLGTVPGSARPGDRSGAQWGRAGHDSVPLRSPMSGVASWESGRYGGAAVDAAGDAAASAPGVATSSAAGGITGPSAHARAGQSSMGRFGPAPSIARAESAPAADSSWPEVLSPADFAAPPTSGSRWDRRQAGYARTLPATPGAAPAPLPRRSAADGTPTTGAERRDADHRTRSGGASEPRSQGQDSKARGGHDSSLPSCSQSRLREQQTPQHQLLRQAAATGTPSRVRQPGKFGNLLARPSATSTPLAHAADGAGYSRLPAARSLGASPRALVRQSSAPLPHRGGYTRTQGSDAFMSPVGMGGHSRQGAGVQVVVVPRSGVAGPAVTQDDRRSEQRDTGLLNGAGADHPAAQSWGPLQALKAARRKEVALAVRTAAALAGSFATEMTLFHPDLTAHRLECIRCTPLVEQTDAMDD